MVLSYAERNLEPIRMGLEDYLTQSTGQIAQITSMTKVELVPYTAFGLKGLSLRSRDEADKTLLTAEKIYVSLPLRTLLLGSMDYYALQAENVEIASSVFLPEKLLLSFAGISDKTPDDGPASLIAEGRYNGQELLLTAALEREAGKKFYIYHFGKQSAVTFKLGEIEGYGVFKRSKQSLGNITLTRGPHRAIFSVDNIFSEDSLSLDGTINGVAFTGTVEKRGDQKILKIIPVYTEKDDDKRVLNFIKIISKDIAIDDKADFIIEVDDAAVPDDESVKE